MRYRDGTPLKAPDKPPATEGRFRRVQRELKEISSRVRVLHDQVKMHAEFDEQQRSRNIGFTKTQISVMTFWNYALGFGFAWGLMWTLLHYDVASVYGASFWMTIAFTLLSFIRTWVITYFFNWFYLRRP